MFDNKEYYGKVTRLFHWGMALLILWQFLTVGARVLMEDTAVEQFMWGTHKSLGVLLLLLIAARIAWALLNLSRRPPVSQRSGKPRPHCAIYVAVDRPRSGTAASIRLRPIV